MPLPLQERITFLCECSTENISKAGRLVTVEVIRTALSGTTVQYHHSTGLGLFDTRPVFTYDDLYDFAVIWSIFSSLSLDPRMLLLPLLVRYPD